MQAQATRGQAEVVWEGQRGPAARAPYGLQLLRQLPAAVPALGSCQLVPLPPDPTLLLLFGRQLAAKVKDTISVGRGCIPSRKPPGARQVRAQRPQRCWLTRAGGVRRYREVMEGEVGRGRGAGVDQMTAWALAA